MWKKIQNYPYYINEYGEVKNILGEILKPLNKHTGYYAYCLYNKKQSKEFLAHRLVASYFIPNLENKPLVNHIDGNKHNNHKSNLEWVTYQENAVHAWNNGLNTSKQLDKGVSQFTLDGAFIQRYASCAEAARATGIKHVHDAAKGTRKSVGGFLWRFDDRNATLKSTGRKKAVVQCDLAGNRLNAYESISEAARKTKINRKSINDCCNKKLRTSGGYKWNFM